MKTTTTTVACLAAALFLSGSALQANGRFEDRNERSSRCELRAELRNERRPVMGHGFHGQRAQTLRLREAQLLAELAALRAREARRLQVRPTVGWSVFTVTPPATVYRPQNQYTQVNPFTSNVRTVTPQYVARPVNRTSRIGR